MAKSQLKVATIVGSSTDTAWSQTYHAGGVTAVVSVRQKEGQESTSLSLVGKDLLNTFESEYFTLETKTLASIKDSVGITFQKSKDTHDISLIVSAVIQSAVYLVLAGKGKVILIRKGNLATLLQQDQQEEVLSASGFLESGDVMVLETLAFSENVPNDMLLEHLSANSVADAAEIMSPQVHKERDGAAAALIFSFEDDKQPVAMPEIPNQSEPEEIPHEAIQETLQETPLISAPPIYRRPRHKMTHKQKIFLTIAFILAIVFVGTVYFSLQKKQTTQNTANFSQLYPPAERKYQEGESLKDLNASLAHGDFIQAQQMLESAKGKFPANSSEQKQILSLLSKVNTELGTNTPPQKTTNVTKVDATTNPFLAFASKHPDAKYFAQDGTSFYFADSTGITKSTGSTEKQIIKNGGDWKSIGGFSTYLGNMYVLDTADGIDKYPVTADGYGNKAAYFTDTIPSLSKAVSIAIDGSVWILGQDGSLSKYTKGKQDSFTVTGLTKPLSSPTQIVTSVDDANVYILDNGNNRMVVIKKDGTFVADYANSILKNATQLDINESAKKAYILSGDSFYELDMK